MSRPEERGKRQRDVSHYVDGIWPMWVPGPKRPNIRVRWWVAVLYLLMMAAIFAGGAIFIFWIFKSISAG
jgi:hypothetical protein